MTNEAQKAVYLFCSDSAIDPVAPQVFRAVEAELCPEELDFTVDGYPVLSHTDRAGNLFYFVRTEKVVSHHYSRYVPLLNQKFADAAVAGLINWHGGQNAPDKILTVHTIGDVISGQYAPANPVYMRNLLLAMERGRQAVGLDEYRVVPEATHWSGIISADCDPALIPRYPVPMMDIEIGSTPESWSDERAAKVIAQALTGIFEADGRPLKRLLCAGGIHFEPAFAEGLFDASLSYAFGISHILANQWLVSGQYDAEEGPGKLEACIHSIQGGIDAIVFHDNLKGRYKDLFRALGQRYSLPVFKHQLLRRPAEIDWQ